MPYRNSKLTRILQESLGGNSKTLLLVACSPAADNASETKSTLQFTSRAKTITNAAVVNTLLSSDQLLEQADKLRAQLRAARAEVERLRGGGGGSNEGGCEGGNAGGNGAVTDDTEARAWQQALAGPAEADGLRAELAAAREAAEAMGEELAESARVVGELEEALKRRDAEAEELHDMLERVQVRGMCRGIYLFEGCGSRVSFVLEAESAESARVVGELEEALKRRDAEAEELHDMLERVQVRCGLYLYRRYRPRVTFGWARNWQRARGWWENWRRG